MTTAPTVDTSLHSTTNMGVVQVMTDKKEKDTMKRSKALLLVQSFVLPVVVVLLVASCGPSRTTEPTNILGLTEEQAQELNEIADQVTIPSTVAPKTTTTLLPVREPVRDVSNFTWSSPVELFPSKENRNCDKVSRAIARDTKIAHKIFTCYENWATGMTMEKYEKVTNCGDCSYEAETLYGPNKRGKWTAIAQCSILDPLVSARQCYEVMRKDLDFPPPKVLCRIWAGNSWLSNIGITKCVPDPEMLEREINNPCSSTYSYAGEDQKFDAGIGKCLTGDIVCVAQEQMRLRGYDVSVTGTYGREFMTAVMHYQQSIGLIPSSHIPRHQWPAMFPGVPYSGESSQHCN